MIKRLSWIFLAILGATTGFLAYTSLSIGTMINVGSAAYPLILSGLIIVIALYVLAVGDKEEIAAVDLRGFTGVISSVVVFIAAIEHIGLIPTVIASMVVAYAGQSRGGYASFLIYASLFAVGTWLLFTLALGLPVPAFEIP